MEKGRRKKVKNRIAFLSPFLPFRWHPPPPPSPFEFSRRNFLHQKRPAICLLCVFLFFFSFHLYFPRVPFSFSRCSKNCDFAPFTTFVLGMYRTWERDLVGVYLLSLFIRSTYYYSTAGVASEYTLIRKFKNEFLNGDGQKISLQYLLWITQEA